MTDFPLSTSHRLQAEMEAMQSSEKLQPLFSMYLIYKNTFGLWASVQNTEYLWDRQDAIT